MASTVSTRPPMAFVPLFLFSVFQPTRTVLHHNNRHYSFLTQRGSSLARRRPRTRCSDLKVLEGSVSAAHSLECVSSPVEPADDFEGDISIFTVARTSAGERLDRVLVSEFSTQSRTYFQGLINEGAVLVDGARARKGMKVRGGESIEVRFLTPGSESELQAEDIDLDILYEDNDIVVVNKKAGMVVHPAPGNWNGTLVNALAFRYGEILAMGGKRPGVVHRLDKGTSGIILAARNERVQRGLTEAFSARRVKKEYIAVCVGNPAGKNCTSAVIDEPIGRSRVDRLRMMVLPEEDGGRPARSIVTTVASDDRGVLFVVKVATETGRTHQIRVHTKHRRAPLLGDELYGLHDVNRRLRTCATRPMLHAHRLRFDHPVKGEPLDISAPLPEDMHQLIKRQIYPDFAKYEPRW